MEKAPEVNLDTLLRDGSLYRAAPRYLHGRIAMAIQSAAASPSTADIAPPRPRRWSAPRWAIGLPFVGGGFAGAVVTALCFVALLHERSPSSADRLAPEIVASHVRALISEREMDVVSTDQHTVKPWFNGRIDYAPPVIDLRPDGFPLTGGRLDYVDRRPVSVIIYRYLLHPIDLYVFPDDRISRTASERAPVALSRDGYSMLEWHHGGMTYWAITDASASHLADFGDAFRRASLR